MMEKEMVWRFLAPVVFGLLALVFALLAWRDKDQRLGTASPARKTRIRIAVIFALVSAVLFFLRARS
jgi:heme A synthase